MLLPSHWAAALGGAEYQARCLIDVIAETELFEIIYLAREINPEFKTNQYKIYNIGSQLGLRRHALFFDFKKLYSTLKSISPDIIYQRVGCSYTGIASRYAKKSGCDMIWHIAIDTSLMPFQVGLSPKTSFKYIEYLLLRYGIQNSPKIIAQTQFQDELLYKRYGRRADAIVPNFHHLPSETIQKEEPIKVVWVANLKPTKRPELFIKLANDCSELINVKFIMIGQPQHKKSWIAKLFDQVKNVKNIEYLSDVSLSEVNEILSKSHIFVNTSLYEGFPNTFIQAWMRRVPVVSLNINPDKVFDKQYIGFCSESYEKLVEDVKRLVTDNVLRISMGKDAQEYAMKMHSMKNADEIIELMR